MSVRATWAAPKSMGAEITDSFTDQYGTEIDDDCLALILDQDGDCFVIEGSYSELHELLDRLVEELEGWVDQ